MASAFGVSYSRVDLACFHGKTFRRVRLAGQFGGSSGLIYSIDLKAREHTVEQKEIEKNEMYHGESVDCDIIM